MMIAKQYLEQILQTAFKLSEMADSMEKDAKHLIQENPQIDGKFQDQDIANDTFFVILCSINIRQLVENMTKYCEQRLSKME